jgi:hypothetical protein
MVTQQVQLVEKDLLTSLDLVHLVVVGFVLLIPLVFPVMFCAPSCAYPQHLDNWISQRQSSKQKHEQIFFHSKTNATIYS